nr:hypothetical protein [Deltaproteobacteria bacterium]
RQLIEAELAFHENWQALSQSGAGGRAAHLLRGLVYSGGDNVAAGIGNSDLVQGARGAAVQTGAGLLIGALAKRIPVPGLGNIIGGGLSAYALFSNGGAGLRQTLGSIGSGVGGAFSAQNWRESPWATAADLVAGIKSILDLIGNVCNILSGLAYAFAAIAAVGGLLSVFFPPLAFLVPYIPAAINFGRACGGIATVAMTVSNLISPIPPLLRAIHIIFSSNDPIRLAAQESTYHSEIQGAIANYGNAAVDRAISGRGGNPIAQFREGIAGGVSTYRGAMGGNLAPTRTNFNAGTANTAAALGPSATPAAAGRSYFDPNARTATNSAALDRSRERLGETEGRQQGRQQTVEELRAAAAADPSRQNRRALDRAEGKLTEANTRVATAQSGVATAESRVDIPSGNQAGAPGGEVGNSTEGAYQAHAAAGSQADSNSASGAYQRELAAQQEANGGQPAPGPQVEHNARGHVQLPNPPGRLGEIDALDAQIEELRIQVPTQHQVTAQARGVQQQAGQRAAQLTGVRDSVQQRATQHNAQSQAEQARVQGQTTQIQGQTTQAQGDASGGTQRAASPLSGIASAARTVDGLLQRIPSNRFFDISGAKTAIHRFVEGMDMITGAGAGQAQSATQTNAALQERTQHQNEAQQVNQQANSASGGLTQRMGADAGAARGVQADAGAQAQASQAQTQTLEQQLQTAQQQRQQKWSQLMAWAVQHRQIRGTVLGDANV